MFPLKLVSPFFCINVTHLLLIFFCIENLIVFADIYLFCLFFCIAIVIFFVYVLILLHFLQIFLHIFNYGAFLLCIFLHFCVVFPAHFFLDFLYCIFFTFILFLSIAIMKFLCLSFDLTAYFM